MRYKEKGREVRFAKFIIILLVLSSVSATLINRFIPNKQVNLIRRMPQQKEITLKILLDRKRQWLIKYIKVGDSQKDLENNPVCEIIGIDKMSIEGVSDVFIVTFRLKASLDSSGFMVYGNNILRPGEDFIFETKEYLLKGIVYSIGE